MTKLLLKEYRSGELDENWPGLNIRKQTYLDQVKSDLLQILLNINQIGEKSFKAIDDAKSKFDAWCEDHPDDLDAIVNKFKNNNLRIEFCAEYCYNKFFKNNNLSIGAKDELFEKRKNSFEILKKNKIPLTDEERNEVIKYKAVWHNGPNGSETAAVWKSKNSKGEIVYVTNTHRAYNKAKTLKGAINKFHSFIKNTA